MLGSQSCSDFLEEDNKTGTTAELSYSTATGINGLVASCYSFSRGWYGKEAGLGLSEMGSDLFYAGFDNKQKSLNAYNLTAESLDNNVADNACLDHYWELFYSAVDACNNALKFIPLNNVISQNLRNQYMGEIYFLRAFYYLHMVNLWGPIPYNNTHQTSIVTNPERVSEDEIYGNILSDIDKSIAAFQAANYATKADGRAHLWAARALKARTLLYAASWLGQTGVTKNSDYAGKNLYTLAATESQAVIGSGIASFYANYADTWTMLNEDVSKNRECIWGVAYSSDITTPANTIPRRYRTNVTTGVPLDYNSLITRTGYSRGGSAMLLMFVSLWNNGAPDLNTNPPTVFIRVTNEATSTIAHRLTGVRVPVAAHYSKYSRGFTRWLPSLYLWRILENIRETDQRPEATLLTAYTIPSGLAGSSLRYPQMQDTAIYYSPLNGDSPQGIAKQAWARNKYRIQFMAGGDVPVFTTYDPATALPTELPKAVSSVYGDSRFNSNNIGGWKSYPGIKKFLDDIYDPLFPTHDISKRDAMVFRLAEMYLIKAEAELATTGSGAALNTLNELRAVRAIPGKNNLLSGTVTINTILEERAIELCGEQQRWFDLKRTKTLVNRVKAYNAQAGGQIKDFHLLRPIPRAQLDAVTNYSPTPGTGFWQNLGY